jgi:tetratricopeptide (TPR) repeat protein
MKENKKKIWLHSLHLLILFSLNTKHVNSQKNLDVHIDSVREIMGGIGMSSLAGWYTDRGGKTYSRQLLRKFCLCRAMLQRSSKAHQNVTSADFYTYTILINGGIADAYLALRRGDSALIYCNQSEKILSSKRFFKLLFIELKKDSERKKSERAILHETAKQVNYYLLEVYQKKALAYQLISKTNLELLYCRRSISMSDFKDELEIKFKIYQEIGETFRRLNKEDSALIYFKKALGLEGQSSIRRAYIFHLMADSYLNRGGLSLEEGIKLYDSARAKVAALFWDNNPMGGGGIKSPYPEHEQANNNIGEADWDPASLFHEDLDEIFSGGTKAWLLKASSTYKNPGSYIDSAFEYSESGRSLGLNRLVKLIQNQNNTRYAAGAIIQRTKASFSLDFSLFPFLKQMKVPVISYRVLKDELLVFLISPPGKVHYFRHQISNDSLYKLITEFRYQLGVGDDLRGGKVIRSNYGGILQNTNRSVDLSVTLSNLLFPKDLISDLPKNGELLIIPHSCLNLLPFSALKIKNDPIINRYSIRLTPSLNFLYYTDKRPFLSYHSSNLSHSLVVAIPDEKIVYIDEDSKILLPRLNFASEEGQSIAKTLGSKLFQSYQIKLDKYFDSLLSDAPIIHFATHGIAFTDVGQEYHSFLSFAPDSLNISELSIRYIINNETPNLKADLVVLSACETGVGSVSGMEGILGLHRAFLAKGARTVVSSLWSISDASTSFLMKQFYWHLLEDIDKPLKAEALRRAQLDTRSKFNDPFNWAGFQVIGAE